MNPQSGRTLKVHHFFLSLIEFFYFYRLWSRHPWEARKMNLRMFKLFMLIIFSMPIVISIFLNADSPLPLFFPTPSSTNGYFFMKPFHRHYASLYAIHALSSHKLLRYESMTITTTWRENINTVRRADWWTNRKLALERLFPFYPLTRLPRLVYFLPHHCVV